MPERTVLTGAGPLEVRQPRVRDRCGASHPDAVRFSSAVLPPYLRRSMIIDELIPWLYLRGVSTSDFQEALQALLGEGAAGLSASTITRLTRTWEEEHAAWSRRDLSGKEYVYLYADSVYFNIRVTGERQCILVVLGVTPEGRKELVGIQEGHREDKLIWRELLLDVHGRGVLSPRDRPAGLCGVVHSHFDRELARPSHQHHAPDTARAGRSLRRRASPTLMGYVFGSPP